MADGAVDNALGDALLELVHQSAQRASPHVRTAVAWLREQAEPPEGVRLLSPDGTEFTGVAIVDHNDVVVLLAARNRPPAPKSPPLVTPPGPRYEPSRFDPRPAHRDLFDDDPGDGWPPNDPFLPHR